MKIFFLVQNVRNMRNRTFVSKTWIGSHADDEHGLIFIVETSSSLSWWFQPSKQSPSTRKMSMNDTAHTVCTWISSTRKVSATSFSRDRRALRNGALELRAAVKISGKVILELRADGPLPLCPFIPLPPRARRRARRLHWQPVQDRAALYPFPHFPFTLRPGGLAAKSHAGMFKKCWEIGIVNYFIILLFTVKSEVNSKIPTHFPILFI